MKGNVFNVLLLTGMIISSSTLPNVQAETSSKDLNILQHKLSESNAAISQKEAEKQKLQQEIEQLKQQVEQFDKEIEENENKLEETRNSIQQTREEIEQKKQYIEQLKEKIQQRQELLKKRLVTLQSQPKTNLVTEVLAGTESLADLLDNLYSLSLIFQSDEEIINGYESDQKQLQIEQNIVEEKEQALATYEAILQQKQTDLDQKQQQKQDTLKTLEQKLNQTLSEIMTAAEEKKMLEAQEQQFQQENQKKQEQQPKAEQNTEKLNRMEPVEKPTVVSTNGFIKPTAGRFTSEFGPRNGEFHQGVDIAASGTVPIVAAESGKVIRSYYSSSYGNVVFISHNINGKSYTTVYAHMRSRSIQEGQTVQQGQQIGIMGNTGFSQGQHLHFEIHAGGWNAAKSNAVNPRLYIG